MDPGHVFIVVPAFNEGPAIGAVVRELRRRYPNVVVVDDGSRDGTAGAAEAAGATVLRHLVNRGQGAALQTGVEHALARGARAVVTFDSDGQHRAKDVGRLLAALEDPGVEVTLGSRFLETGDEVPPLRRLLLKTAVLFTRATSGLPVTDAHNGLRALSRRAAAGLDLHHDRMAHASELVDWVRTQGLPFVEVPVRIRYTDYSRGKGQSGWAALRIAWEYLLRRLLR